MCFDILLFRFGVFTFVHSKSITTNIIFKTVFYINVIIYFRQFCFEVNGCLRWGWIQIFMVIIEGLEFQYFWVNNILSCRLNISPSLICCVHFQVVFGKDIYFLFATIFNLFPFWVSIFTELHTSLVYRGITKYDMTFQRSTMLSQFLKYWFLSFNSLSRKTSNSTKCRVTILCLNIRTVIICRIRF